MRPEIERVDPQTLEIAVIDRFKKKLKDIHSAVSTEDDDNNPNTPIITVQSNGNGLRYSYRESPTIRLDEFYAFEPSEMGEVIACEFDEYEDRGNTTDVLRTMHGQIRTKDGALAQSINPQVIQDALGKLYQIEKKITAPTAQSVQEVPLTRPLGFH